MNAPLAATLFLALASVLTNIFGLYAGYPRDNRLQKTAFAAGACGLGSLIGLVVTFADAMSQIWSRRPGYEGLPVWVCLVATIAATLCSLVAGLAVFAHEHRWFRN